MSRIGKAPVIIPSGVKTDLKENVLKVEGPLGKLSHRMPSEISVEIKDGKIFVKRINDASVNKAMHGLWQRMISNMVIGVTKGYEKNLEIVGVGYRAKIEGKALVMQLRFSHQIKYPMPEGITIAVAENTKINVKGADKQMVGQVAAEIRRYLPPEPYKGKGIRYVGEYVRRKAGKAVAGKGAAAGGGK